MLQENQPLDAQYDLDLHYSRLQESSDKLLTLESFGWEGQTDIYLQMLQVR